MLGSNDQTHHCSKEQRDRYGQLYVLKRKAGGSTPHCRNSHRPEFSSALQERHRIAVTDPCARPSFTDSQWQRKSEQQQHNSRNLAGSNSWCEETWQSRWVDDGKWNTWTSCSQNKCRDALAQTHFGFFFSQKEDRPQKMTVVRLATIHVRFEEQLSPSSMRLKFFTLTCRNSAPKHPARTPCLGYDQYP